MPPVILLLLTRVPGTKPRCEPKPFEQTPSGFEGLQPRLLAFGLEPASILIVMEATAIYWVSLATTLSQAGFAVSVINPAQAHHFAKAQLKRAKTDVLDAQTLAELAQALIASTLDTSTTHLLRTEASFGATQ